MAVAAATALSMTAAAPPADPAADSCSWRLAAKVLYQELSVQTSDRAQSLRRILANAGAGEEDFVPLQCRNGGTSSSPSDRDAPTTDDPRTEDPSADARSGSTTSSGGAPGGSARGGNGPCATTAADAFGWGTPNRSDDFESEASTGAWGIYDGQGHDGNGTRSPAAISVLDGLLTITGDPSGQSGGMAWNPGQVYGRWEGCVRSPVGSNDLHSLLLLWPDAENWPVGGEVDFMEISDPSRQTVEGFLHYGAENSQEVASVDVDATEWHAFAVEWTADRIAYYVDAEQWFETMEKSHLPPGPMHLTIQLDNFGNPDQETSMHVDWVRQYSLDGSASGTPSSNAESGTSTDAAGTRRDGGDAQDPRRDPSARNE
ncbi:glycoside hydrolase family 16 protein [Pseudonocardia sp. WMMC193]|uniref:glycoside hydrolase family 16 protein n=1 Tax=Pseudonocardia sp. WMMC193 TaxID=2911965 RepID=UPI001F1CB16A|nr:glycoside hydrolase family 16 protein [Pseudonocardia sp. WMMC193]MCF7552568.1 glycoside hydrolase family 16 protein [Pseudonocardia sp. WMMC193]